MSFPKTGSCWPTARVLVKRRASVQREAPHLPIITVTTKRMTKVTTRWRVLKGARLIVIGVPLML